MRRKLLCLLLAAVLLCALCVGYFVLSTPAHGLPVLMYHHIVEDGEECNDMTVTVSRFREDMQWLIDHGYTFVLPRELAAGNELPEKPVMVTFDDGYRSNYELLLPILKEMNVKIALALIVSMPDLYHADSFLNWDMCREMSESGLVEFGSHTYNLHNFDGRGGAYTEGGVNGIARKEGETQQEYEARVWTDLQASIDTIERELGTDVVYLAYPYGVTDPWADEFVQEHFSVTTITRRGTSDLDRGLYNLKRYTITMNNTVKGALKR